MSLPVTVEREPALPGSGTAGTGARPVLIADDDPIARLLIAQYLAVLGLTNPLRPCASGDEVVAELERAAQGRGPLPALILLDGQMPGRSGMQVLAWIQATPAVAGIPVVMLSGQDQASDVNSAYTLGARSYLVKPVGFEALGAVIRDLGLPWQLT